jgi:DNA-binding transcriptional LysR family regulator
MDLRALRYYVTAVNEGSISAASQRCHVAQPSITLAISKLEDQFECQLLIRHRKGVSTTPKGQELYQMATELLLHADAIETRLSRTDEKLKLKLAVLPSVQISYIERLVSAARALSLELEFEVINEFKQADILLCSKSSAPKQQAFYPIAGERYALLIPKTNPLAYQSRITYSDLNGQALIERYHCENRALFDKVIEHFDLQMPIVARVENEEWALSLVASGIGLSISPLADDFADPRFNVRFFDEISDMESPERQVGFSFKANQSAPLQNALDELSRYFTRSDSLVPVDSLSSSFSMQDA